MSYISYIYTLYFPRTHTSVSVFCEGSQESLVPEVLTGHTCTEELLCAPRRLFSNSTRTTNPQSLPLYIVSVSKTLHCNEFTDLEKLCLIYFRQDEQKRQCIPFNSPLHLFLSLMALIVCVLT